MEFVVGEAFEKFRIKHIRDTLLGVRLKCNVRNFSDTRKSFFATYNDMYLTIGDMDSQQIVMHHNIGDITHRGEINLKETPIDVDIIYISDEIFIIALTSTGKSLVNPRRLNIDNPWRSFKNPPSKVINDMWSGTNYRHFWELGEHDSIPFDYLDRIFLIRDKIVDELLQFRVSHNKKFMIMDTILKPGMLFDRRLLDIQQNDYKDIHSEWGIKPYASLPSINITEYGLMECKGLDKYAFELTRGKMVGDIEITLWDTDHKIHHTGKETIRLNSNDLGPGSYVQLFNGTTHYKWVGPQGLCHQGNIRW
jgi:hypothetical protein